MNSKEDNKVHIKEFFNKAVISGISGMSAMIV